MDFMAMSDITICMDAELVQQLQELLSELGLDMTTFLTLAAEQAVREQAIPFSSTTEKIPNAEAIRAMQDAEKGTESAGHSRRLTN